MTIGIIVDGQAEPEALRKLFPKLRGVGTILQPLYADLQPKAAPGQIARKALSRVRMLRQRSAERVILLLDREDRSECPPRLAGQIAKALDRLGEPGINVVVKNRAIENWLIADPGCPGKLEGRFRSATALTKRVSPNKADNVRKAASLLDRIAVRRPHHKRRDPPRIVQAMDVASAAGNSRSLRRFLRVLGDERYRDQSRLP